MISVPIKLLHEAESHVVTIELKSGEMFRGYLMEAEDTMNVRLDDVKMTGKDGKVTHLDQLYLRGSQIKFIIVPDMLKNSPMFKKIKNQTKAAKQANIANCLITDAGCTQIPPGSKTVLGIGPDTSEKINKITGTFKLMH